MATDNEWNNGRCLGVTKLNNQCNKSSINKSDFCHLHNKYSPEFLKNKRLITKNKFKLPQKSLIDLSISYSLGDYVTTRFENQTSTLNQNCEQLMYIYDDWNQIPLYRRVLLDNNWWDVSSLISHFSHCLNSSNMNNPSPMYPSNPFNRIKFTKDGLIKLRQHLYLTMIEIPISVYIFLDMCLDRPEVNNTILDTFSNWLRFKIINYKDSQNCYQGVWVYKYTELSDFEILFQEWNNMPYQQMVVNHHGEYIVTENIQRIMMQHILETCPVEQWSPLKISANQSIKSFRGFFV